MLNIYYGRESIDKEKFIYSAIRARGYSTEQPVLVIVPDQYTLDAERQAFRYLETECLLGLDVCSLSRLGHQILNETGGGRRTFIDKYGRQMLLVKIVRELEEQLQIFRVSSRKNSFIELTNDFISDMKQYGITPEVLQCVLADVEKDGLLYRKLSDLCLIYSAYQERIAGKYTDSEDYIDLYIEKVKDSGIVRGAVIWVYGFDSFSPKSLQALGGLMGAAEEMNVVLTYDRNAGDAELFELTASVAGRLRQCAEDAGCGIGVSTEIRDAAGRADLKAEKNAAALEFLEHELFAPTPEKFPGEPDGVTIVEAANFYGEVESAASHVLSLIRDKGYRRRDIAIICNDQGTRAPVIRRVFNEYGIDLFMDAKRSILNSGVAVFLLSMLTVVSERYRSQDVFTALKTGFSGLPPEAVDELENYVLKYHVRGMMWKKDFTLGVSEYGEEGLEALNELRTKAVTFFEGLEARCAGKQTNREFLIRFYRYLTEDLHIGDTIARAKETQESEALLELAEETAQVWDLILGLFDQIEELIGDEPFEIREFTELLKTGLSQIQVGILPATQDDILLGTMQRTRSVNVRAVLILAANEGILPAAASDDSLFGPDELESLAAAGHEICKTEPIRVREERLAMYRNLSKPSDELWISYSCSDEEGKEIRKSSLIEDLQNIFPDLKTKPDVLNAGRDADLIGGKYSTLRHLTDQLNRAARGGEEIDAIWQPVYAWYRENEAELTEMVERGLRFENQIPNLSRERVQMLFRDRYGERMLSPSRLESYSRCPFSYFIDFGLAPRERRVYEAAGREIGDVYHHCIMNLTQRLSREGLWETITDADCRRLVSEAVAAERKDYREGLFRFGNRERYRARRMEEVCYETLRMLVQQARAGKIAKSSYEVRFGRGAEIEPIVLEIDGQKIFIEGQIDRVDILENDRLKIIDYKSGQRKLDPGEIRAGYSLQLMVYLEAAGQKGRKPGGVFYFHIHEKRVSTDGYSTKAISTQNLSTNDVNTKDLSTNSVITNGVSTEGVNTKDAGGTPGDPGADPLSDPLLSDPLHRFIADKLRNSFRLTGLMVNDPETVDAIAGELSGGSKGSSGVVESVKRSKDGTISGKAVLSEEEFEDLQKDVAEKLEEICRSLLNGEIGITPMKIKDRTACDYCANRSICRFDTDFKGCSYRKI